MKLGKIEKVVLIGLLYLIYAAVLAAWGLSYDSWQLTEQLKQLSPLFLEVNFFLILLGLLLNLRLFKKATSRIQRKTWAILLLIAVVGTSLALFVAPRTHRIFYDEDIYMNVAQNIAHIKKAGICNEGEDSYGEYSCD
jgi:drug/metabolite transporter (DMT)-like permease